MSWRYSLRGRAGIEVTKNSRPDPSQTAGLLVLTNRFVAKSMYVCILAKRQIFEKFSLC